MVRGFLSPSEVWMNISRSGCPPRRPPSTPTGASMEVAGCHVLESGLVGCAVGILEWACFRRPRRACFPVPILIGRRWSGTEPFFSFCVVMVEDSTEILVLGVRTDPLPLPNPTVPE